MKEPGVPAAFCLPGSWAQPGAFWAAQNITRLWEQTTGLTKKKEGRGVFGFLFCLRRCVPSLPHCVYGPQVSPCFMLCHHQLQGKDYFSYSSHRYRVRSTCWACPHWLCHLGKVRSQNVSVFYGWGSWGEGLWPFLALWAGVKSYWGRWTTFLAPPNFCFYHAE